MDLVDLIAEKRFVGQDFLLWLWWKSETSGGYFSLDNGETIGVSFGGKMRLESTDENVICNGKSSSLSEAMTGITVGKKPEQAFIKIECGGNNYGVVFVASLFEFKGFQMPKVAPVEGDDDADGYILERVYLHEAIVAIFEELFVMFMCDGNKADKISQWAFNRDEAEA